ncbi:MAG: hypothetical protein JWQ90_2621 [Hydrocarboniphaga sp.]|uniref:TonB-dependent receptor n=1 Tax=Hydrocarboniphaga sp. TaxID=2033016 RepID=UPI00261E56A2|nr:TonB-dependent receptor [Hydrocarboniphaga sp.]MDB5970171.1 hypothetical protein [Hydrocarboniphaga sp.]
MRIGILCAMLSAGLLSTADASEVSTAGVDSQAPASEAPAPEVPGPEALAREAEAAETVPVIPVETAIADEPTIERTPSSANRFVEEIVVTAQKREEKLQDVPIAITSFSADALEARGISDPKGLAAATPGMTYSDLNNYSIIYLRGVGTEVFVPSADTSVATYLDGIYLPFNFSLAQDFVPLQRIEVLKGPQGTLFGRNSTGGAISIVTKDIPEEFSGKLSGEATSLDEYSTKAYIGGHPVDSIGVSLAAIYSNKEQYNHVTDESVVRSLYHEVTKAANLKLRWEPTTDLSLQLNALFVNQFGGGGFINTAQDPKPLGKAVGVRALGPYEVEDNVKPTNDVTNRLYYGVFAWRPDWFDVKLLGSHQQVEASGLYDYDASKQPTVLFAPDYQFAKITTSELQLLSKPGGLVPDSLTVTAGLYYFKQSAGYDPIRLVVLDPASLGALVGNVTNPNVGTAAQAIIDGVLAPLSALGLPIPVGGASLAVSGVVDTKAYAAYSQFTWRPLESFDKTILDRSDFFGITVGGRYQDENRGRVKSTTGLVTATGVLPVLNFGEAHAINRTFSPKISLEVKPSDDQLFYFTAQRGDKSGTYNPVAIYSPPTYVKPEKLQSFELGNKGAFFDRTVKYGIAAFDTRIEDLQTLIISLQSGGTVGLSNAASARIRGFDFDTSWQMLPETLPGLVATLSGAYLHGIYGSFPNASGFDETTGLFFGPGSLTLQPGRDFSGNRITRTPKWTINTGLSYSFEAPGGPIEIAADYYYNSGYFYDTQNTVNQKAYGLTNARVSYLYEPWNLRIQVFVRNLTDTQYYYNRFPNDFSTNSYYAPPRSYGLSLSWEF